MLRRRNLALLAAVVVALTVTGEALAYLASNGTGSGTASAGPFTAGRFARFVVADPGQQTAGVQFALSITAVDNFSHTVTAYNGPECLTFSGPGSAPTSGSPTYPAKGSCSSGSAVTFLNGVATGANATNLTLVKTETVTLTVTDNPTGFTGTRSLAVVGGTAASLVVAGFPSPQNAGAVGAFSVTAKDAFGNTATGYTGTVQFTSSDAQVTSGSGLPANYAFLSGDAGTHTFSATLKTAGTQSITATDTVTGTITGNQTAITITAPTVTNVTSTLANGSYRQGQSVPVTVTFTVPVTVTGAPQLLLETGTTDESASYASGTGTSTLTFNYSVQPGDASPDLAYQSVNALTLNGGTIKDAAGTVATLTLPALNAAGSLSINKAIVIDTTLPTVTTVTSPLGDGSYTVGQLVPVTVSFSEPVNVTGTPQLLLETGTTDESAGYASGTGTSTLTFNYTVQAGDTSGDLAYENTSALTLGGATIDDAAGNVATVTLPALGAAGSLSANKTIVIDTTSPTVTAVNSTLANGSYTVGQVVPVTVTFSEPVIVTGTPELLLETGTTDRQANYASGTGSTLLTFNYTVQAGDTSADLDYASTAALTLNSGTIKDAVTNAAILTLVAPAGAGSLGANRSIVIDTTAPTVTNVTSTLANGSYKQGQVVPVTVAFSEPVNVTGTPQLLLETGTTDESAGYSSGTGTNTLTFNYTVQAGDTSGDLDYQGVNALTLNGGTIKDAATNAATLALVAPAGAGSLGANRAIVIDTTAPTVTAVSSTLANGSYKLGQVVPVTVTFSEPVIVIGTPQLLLETGTTDREANYASGTGSTVLTFNYTVQAGDTSADLDYASTAALTLNSGTIKDAVTNAATLTLVAPGAAGSLGANKAIVIDTTSPTVTNLTSTLVDGSYKQGQLVPVTVAFSEAVNVTGTPQLTLSTGTPATTAVSYVSGSGSSTLTFNYTVVAGNTSADLNYAATTSLALNSGAIMDAASNNATLTLPALAAAGSLGINKAIVIDTTSPTVPLVTLADSITNASGWIRPGGGDSFYFIYANASDAGSGISSLTVNASLITSGQTAVPLTSGGPWVIDGVSYGYRSAKLLADTGLTIGLKTFTATGVDGAGNAFTTGTSSVTVDNTAPKPTNVTLGGNFGKATAGDTVTVTYDTIIASTTFCSAWSNNTADPSTLTASNVTVTITDGGANDTLTVSAGAACSFNFGTVTLANYVNTGSNATFSGTISWSPTTTTLKITLGANLTGSGNLRTGVGTATPTYTAAPALRDRPGNGVSTVAKAGTSSGF